MRYNILLYIVWIVSVILQIFCITHFGHSNTKHSELFYMVYGNSFFIAIFYGVLVIKELFDFQMLPDKERIKRVRRFFSR